ncbi:MAG: PDZ domain-containing protein, partial [Solirubrobacterales bacterium]|nr:PDZ domain-containing protein [Solirubrobacterales bacterium]
MPARARQPLLTALAVAIALALLALGMWLGGHPEDLPGFMQHAFLADRETPRINQAIDTVAHDYYRPVAKRTLARASIEGMLASLDDPYSAFLTESELHQFDEPSTFTGIGVSVGSTPAGLRVERVFDSSPAAHAGLRAGEVIVAVDHRRLAGLPVSTATGLVRGPPGTTVRITLRRGSAERTISIMRATIQTPVVASSMHTVDGVKLGAVYLATFSEEAHAQLATAIRGLLHRG